MLVIGTRHVNRCGANGSLAMRLPLGWARAAGVKDGDSVLSAFGSGRLLIIAPKGAEKELEALVSQEP